ncbi:MAG: bifunctional demethylmenaquinone methyltransferase/2-methoxy-6-polyprenyl-1,4-benzoquinol methylase UbiE [Candidatus Hydrothermarchaeaceae archaeon]
MGEKEKYVLDMFSSIAHRYDSLNTVLSLNQDKYWRRFAVERSGLSRGGSALDVATGTGKLAMELSKAVGPEGEVVGLDFCREMLDIAEKKCRGLGIELEKGNAQKLPYEDETFDIAIIGFGLRNVDSIDATLAEMARVVKMGGKVISLEFSQPDNSFLRRIYYAYFFRIIPLIGGAISNNKDAYSYLPDSVRRFPGKKELAKIMKKSGLENIEIHSLTWGIVAVHIGVKSA